MQNVKIGNVQIYIMHFAFHMSNLHELYISKNQPKLPSFDIVSKVDVQALDNAINVVKKEITNRFDFKDSPVELELNKKDFTLHIETGDDMKMRQLLDVLV